jgi:hypothetical protein
METLKEKTPTRSYDTPAVVYEATLVAHASTTTCYPTTSCPKCSADLLDLFQGN